MKLLARVSSLVLAVCLLITGCAKSSELTANELQELLSNAYELEYIFDMAGLSVDGKHPAKDEAGTLYFPVQSDKYKTLEDVSKLVEATYSTELAAKLLATVDSDGALLYADVDGKLCRSASPIIGGSTTTLNAKSVKLGKPEKNAEGKQTVSFTVTELAADETEKGKLTLNAVEEKAGWRLATRRLAVVKADDEQTTPEGNRFETTAQQFLDALVAGDGSKVKELVIYNDEMGFWDWEQISYSFVADEGITEAKLLETLVNEDYEGRYVVSITAGASGDAFAKGSNRYVMTVSPHYNDDNEGDGARVTGLWLESDPPYESLPFEEQTNRAINQLLRLLNLHGMIQFSSPKDISNDMLTEYLMYMMVSANPEKIDIGFTLDEVQSMAAKLLGMNSFTPAERFYNSDRGLYNNLGRGGVFTNARLRVIEEANGLVKVEARLYNDPLQLDSSSSIIYTMKNNWNGTYELVSGVLEQE